MDKQKFTHFDQNGHAVMVDVTGKTETDREATAVGRIRVSSQVYDCLLYTSPGHVNAIWTISQKQLDWMCISSAI